MTDQKKPETSSWSPCHIGRAKAIAEAHPHMFYSVEANEQGEPVRLHDTGSTLDVYGSDLGAHLELLAERERSHPRR